ncbi:OmpH family outer membrane protein [[Pseudomonas] boreopolis]|uniref:OmpH family outer membrane protein n=1 Tax=Xanthomonas boreopolis TaxID=86183 RepID=UPI003D54DE6F
MKKISLWMALALPAAASLPLPGLAQESATSLGGSAVPGVCLLSREAVFANAKVGKSTNEKLQQFTRTAQTEIGGEQAALDQEMERLGLRRPGLQESQLNEQQRAAMQKFNALRQKAAERGRQIEATRLKAMQRISDEAQPVIAQVYASHKCGLLLDRGSVLGGNLSNDLTAEVVAGLDAKIAALPIALEPVPAAAGDTR